MSTRMIFGSINSLDPIRDAVASGDKKLAEAVIALYEKEMRDEYGDDEEEDEEEEEDDEFHEYVESMILCRKPPKAEPGCWNYVMPLLAEHFKLKLNDNLPANDGWKQYYTWEPYRRLVADKLTPQSKQSLKYLEDGRPLKGTKIDHDGCMFAWLTPEEVKELHQSLSQVDLGPADEDDDDGMAEFHEVLVDTLKTVARRKAVLLLRAH
jgi:hypothetical protein